MSYFLNSCLACSLDNHLNCVIFVRCNQHIVDNMAVVHDLRDITKFAFERIFSYKIFWDFPKCWVVRGNLRIKTSMLSFDAVIYPG